MTTSRLSELSPTNELAPHAATLLLSSEIGVSFSVSALSLSVETQSTLDKWIMTGSAYSTAVSVRLFGAKGNGTTDDTSAIQSAIDSGAGAVFFPAGTYKITAAITVARSVEIVGSGAPSVIRQATWGAPVFDVLADDVSVRELLLLSTESRDYNTVVGYPGAVRAFAPYTYSAGVWTGGSRISCRDLIVDGFVSGVFHSSWDPVAQAKNKNHYDNVVRGLTVANVDFGVLMQGQYRPTVESVRGSYSICANSPNPPHLVYVSGASGYEVHGLTVSDLSAQSSNGHVLKMAYVVGGTASGVTATSCAGVVLMGQCQDVVVSAVTSIGDTNNDGVCSIALNPANTRCVVSDAVISRAANNRSLWVDGTDCVVRNVAIAITHTTYVGNKDVYVVGTRNVLDAVTVRNTDPTKGWVGIMLAAGTGHVVRGPQLVNCVSCIDVIAACTNCLIEWTDVSLVPSSGGNVMRIYEPTTMLVEHVAVPA